ncbi:hypothetical protein AERO8C_120443 [Aeromonas veronii]|uniref:Uncharacterized protein n=1 Tax=Aeromonas veronii TaxID=654 RepID=A0A653KSA6_AERVE|nr:hypothetical protein AERO8C_120443 [Aeromonas veronii]
MAKHHGVQGEVLLELGQQRQAGRARQRGQLLLWLLGVLQHFGAAQQLVDAGQIAAQELHRRQQGFRVVLLEIGELQLIAKGLQRPVDALVMGVGLVHQNGVTEPLARLGELQEYLLKSFQYDALLELRFQPAVGVVAGGGALVNFQRQQVEAQQAGKLGARRMAAAQAGIEGRFGEGQRAHQIDVELGQIVANGLGAVLVRREEAGLFQQVAAKGEVALGQLLVQGLVGQQPEPDKRDQPVPEGASAEGQRLVEEIRCLGGTQHGVDGDQQRAKTDSGVAGTERSHHHEDKGGAGQPDGKQPGGGVEILHAQGRKHEADERHGEVFEPSPQAVVGFGDGARHYPEGEQHGELDIAGGQGEGEQTENGQQHLEGEVDVTIGQQSAQQAREIHRHETGTTLERNEGRMLPRQARSGPDLDQGRFASYP